jgi:arginase
MARSYIPVNTARPIDNIAVRIVRSRWWKQRKGTFSNIIGGQKTSKTVPKMPELAPKSHGQWQKRKRGLLFVDGHEDTMPLDVSEDGEAANAEIGLLLGLTGRLLHGPLADRLPGLRRCELALLGPRDVQWRRQFNVGSLRDHGVWLRDCQEVARAPRDCAREAVRHLRDGCSRWWLHVDLDVLDPSVFSAQGLPDVEDEPGGLTWDQLTQALTVAVSSGGCVGMSIAIYDPDQDTDRSQAQRITSLVAEIAAALP